MVHHIDQSWNPIRDSILLMYQKLKDLDLDASLYTQAMANNSFRKSILENCRQIFESFSTNDQYDRIEYLAEGEENYIYKIVGDKSSYVARILKLGNVRTKKDYEFEFAFQNLLRQKSIPVPNFYKTVGDQLYSPFSIEDEQTQVTLHEFVEGEHITPPTIAHVKAVGTLLGRLHRLATELNLPYDRLEHVTLYHGLMISATYNLRMSYRSKL